METEVLGAPTWVIKLLRAQAFFQPCPTHKLLNNRGMLSKCTAFCITCASNTNEQELHGLCQHCMQGPCHSQHQIIQVRRYVYCDVLRAQDIAPHMNIEGVQSYIINQASVLFINPRPGSAPRTGQAGPDVCRTCCRTLRKGCAYCCLACKVASLVSGDPWTLTKDVGEAAPASLRLALPPSHGAHAHLAHAAHASVVSWSGANVEPYMVQPMMRVGQYSLTHTTLERHHNVCNHGKSCAAPVVEACMPCWQGVFGVGPSPAPPGTMWAQPMGMYRSSYPIEAARPAYCPMQPMQAMQHMQPIQSMQHMQHMHQLVQPTQPMQPMQPMVTYHSVSAPAPGAHLDLSDPSTLYWGSKPPSHPPTSFTAHQPKAPHYVPPGHYSFLPMAAQAECLPGHVVPRQEREDPVLVAAMPRPRVSSGEAEEQNFRPTKRACPQYSPQPTGIDPDESALNKAEQARSVGSSASEGALMPPYLDTDCSQVVACGPDTCLWQLMRASGLVPATVMLDCGAQLGLMAAVGGLCARRRKQSSPRQSPTG